MKRFLTLLALSLAPLCLMAHIGKTEAECRVLYGDPTLVSPSGSGTVETFHPEPYVVRIKFYADQAIEMEFRQSDGKPIKLAVAQSYLDRHYAEGKWGKPVVGKDQISWIGNNNGLLAVLEARGTLRIYQIMPNK